MAITQEATEALFVQIIGPIWYYNTTCSGTEARFDDCPANFTQSFCLFAGVRCPGKLILLLLDAATFGTFPTYIEIFCLQIYGGKFLNIPIACTVHLHTMALN